MILTSNLCKYSIHPNSSWTSADATNLFLCGFVVTAPMATTFKITYKSKKKALEGRMNVFIDQLNDVSPDAGMCSVCSA